MQHCATVAIFSWPYYFAFEQTSLNFLHPDSFSFLFWRHKPCTQNMYIPLWIGKQELSPWFGNTHTCVCTQCYISTKDSTHNMYNKVFYHHKKNSLISSWYRSTVNWKAEVLKVESLLFTSFTCITSAQSYSHSHNLTSREANTTLWHAHETGNRGIAVVLLNRTFYPPFATYGVGALIRSRILIENGGKILFQSLPGCNP